MYTSCQFSLLVSDPIYFEEVVEKKEWQQAMMEEMNVVKQDETWKIVYLPDRKNVIALNWVYRTEYNDDGSIQEHKARLVTKEYAQHQKVDFDEAFSSVACFETVRNLLALAAQLSWPVYQFDVKTAFLNGDLEEEIYVAQPDGFVVRGQESKV